MVVVKKKPPLGEDGLPDLTAPPKYRLCIDAKEGTSVVVLTDHAANAGIEKKQTVNNSKISNWLLELQEFQPFSILYREGASGVM